MPTVMRIGAVRVVIYPNDHAPPHAHALRADGAHARMALNCPRGPVELMDQAGYRWSEILAIGRAIADKLASVCAAWEAYHG